MTAELRYAKSEMHPDDLKAWGAHAAKDLARAFSRRVLNVAHLVTSVGTGTWNEAKSAYAAAESSRLGNHLSGRLIAAKDGTYTVAVNSVAGVRKIRAALKENPTEAGSQLLTTVVVSLLVSGGPDGDGGVPDMDLMLGIGAHRSILTHSIIAGSLLEAGFLSLVKLTLLVQAKLPASHDPLWDAIARHADAHGLAANKGASLGMAYHLFVDGLVQPAAYHDLPISMPMEGHEAIIVTNATAEALDVSKKNSAAEPSQRARRNRTPPPQTIYLPRSAAENVPKARAPSSEISEAAHKAYSSQRFEPDERVAKRMAPIHLDLLRTQGAWLSALADGTLQPRSAEEARFLRVANGEVEAISQREKAWKAYRLLARLYG